MKIMMVFFPAFIGTSLYMHLKKQKLNSFNLFIKYGIIAFIVNLIEMGYLYFTSEYKYTSLTNVDGTISFTFKYMLMGLILSFVVGGMLFIIEKSVVLDIEVENAKKDAKQTTKSEKNIKKENIKKHN